MVRGSGWREHLRGEKASTQQVVPFATYRCTCVQVWDAMGGLSLLPQQSVFRFGFLSPPSVGWQEKLAVVICLLRFSRRFQAFSLCRSPNPRLPPVSQRYPSEKSSSAERCFFSPFPSPVCLFVRAQAGSRAGPARPSCAGCHEPPEEPPAPLAGSADGPSQQRVAQAAALGSEASGCFPSRTQASEPKPAAGDPRVAAAPRSFSMEE